MKPIAPSWIGLIVGCCIAGTNPVTAAPSENGFRFEDHPPLPIELTGASVGRAFGDLVVAGGERDNTHPNRTVYVLRRDADHWEALGEWDTPPVGAAVAETDQGLVCVGGSLARSAFLLDPREDTLRRKALPDVPVELEGVRAAGIGNKVYLVGRRVASSPDATSTAFLELDVGSPDHGWQSLPPCPGPPRSHPAIGALQGMIYVAGGEAPTDPPSGLRDAYRYEPGREWTQIQSPPETLVNCRALACGASHLLVAGGSIPRESLLAYHSITDTWVQLDVLPSADRLIGATSSDASFTLVGSRQVLQGEAVLTPTKYGWLDHGVVTLYVIGMLLIGTFLARRKGGTQDYFRGGQRIPWWASGLSLFATGASAISLMAMPGKAFAENWAYFSISIYSALMLPIVILVFVPIARRLKVATSNEYLERRFNLGIRLFGGVIFSLNQMLARMASVMLLPSIALSAIAGIPMETSILIMGGVTTVYVTLGGLEAVVWTDVIQALVMLASVLVCIVWAVTSLQSDASASMQILADQQKLHMFDVRFDLLKPTVFLMAANIFVTTLGGIGDQNFIQRVQCTRNEREARKAVITQMSVAVPLNFVLFSLGTVLFLYYREHPELLNPALRTDGIYPLFAAQMLPPGIAGLVVASLLAATMSTLSSAVNSVANVGVEDFYRRLVPTASDAGALRLGRALSVALGVFGTCAALLLARTSLTSIWDLAVLVTGIVAAPIAGIFTLGIFTRRANSAGVLLGSLAAIATAVYARYGMTVHPFFNLVAGVAACLVVGYVASRLIPSAPRDLKGLTLYTLTPPEEEQNASGEAP